MPIPSITTLPTAPVRSDSTTFESRADALMTALPTMVTELNTANDAVDAAVIAAAAEADAAAASAVASANSATAALASENAAAVNANAGIWVSGTTYSIGNVRFSPTTYQSYRRKTNGAGTTDPASDTTNWAILFGAPSVSGNSGKFLSNDGSAPRWDSIPGLGGAGTSGSVTLTASSSGMQRITTTAAGQSVTLPNATTCTKSSVLFSIFNAGSWALEVRNSAGTILGAIDPYTMGTVGLSDNSTSAGVWSTSNLQFWYCDAEGAVTCGTNVGGSQNLRVVVLDADRTLLLLSGNASLYGVVYTTSTRTFGTPTLIRTANLQYHVAPLKIATDKVLVVSVATSSTGMEAVCLSLSGSTITVGTAATAALAEAITSFSPKAYDRDLVAVGSSYLYGYMMATSAGVRAITVSGTTCTIGTQYTTTGAAIPPKIFDVDGTKAMVLSQANGSSLYFTPLSVSGTTLTAGTQTSIAASTGSAPRRITYSGGRWLVVFNYDSTQIYGGVVSLSGTVASSTSTALLTGVSTTIVTHDIGGKILAVATDGGTTVKVNVLTDSGGTAVAGTTFTFFTYSHGIYYAGKTGTELRLTAIPANGSYAIYVFGISGNNPSLLRYLPYAQVTSGISNFQLQDSASQGVSTKYPRTLINGDTRNAAYTTLSAFLAVYDGTSVFTTRQLPLSYTDDLCDKESDLVAWWGRALEGTSGSITRFYFTRVRIVE